MSLDTIGKTVERVDATWFNPAYVVLPSLSLIESFMSLAIVCAGCGASFRVKEEWAGRRAPCPKCGRQLVIGETPSPEAAQAVPAATQPEPAIDVAAFKVDVGVVAARPRTPVAAPARKPTLLIGGATVAVGLVGGIAWLLLGGDRQEARRPAVAISTPTATAVALEVATSAPPAGSQPEPSSTTIAAFAPTPDAAPIGPVRLARSGAHSKLAAALAALQPENSFDAEYAETLEHADAIDWRPTDDTNKEWIQRAAGGSAFSRPRGLAKQQLAALTDSFATRTWDYARQVEPLNAFAIDVLNQGPGRVMFFGKVVHTFQETHVTRVQLLGRGYMVEVYEFVDPKRHRKLGETLLVMGMRPPGLQNAVHRVAAGVAMEVKITDPPRDTALEELRDFVFYRFPFRERQTLVISPKRNFPQVKFAAAGEPQQVYTFQLNTTGAGFDAIRIPASTAKPDDELIWSVSLPPDRLGEWGITSVAGAIKTDQVRASTIADYKPTNLTLPTRNETLVVHVQGEELAKSRRHLLWFEFRGRDPVEVTLTGIYRPTFAAPPGPAKLLTELGLTRVTSSISQREQQVFSKVPCTGDDDDTPTITGTPLSRATP